MYRAILHPGAFRPVWEYLMYASRYPSPWGVPNIVPESTLYLKQRKYTSFQLVQFFDLYHFACIIKVWGVKKCQTGCLELIPVVHCFVFLHQPQGWNKLIVISSLKSKTCCGPRLPQKEGLLIHVGHLGYYLLWKDRKRTLKGRTLVKMLPSFVVGRVVTTVSSSHWL